MYRKTAITLLLAVAGCGLAAMVKAQDPGRTSPYQPAAQPTLLEQVGSARHVERMPATSGGYASDGEVMLVQGTEPVEQTSPTRRSSLLEQRLQALRETVLGEETEQQASPEAAPTGEPHPAVQSATQQAAPVAEMPSVLGHRSAPAGQPTEASRLSAGEPTVAGPTPAAQPSDDEATSSRRTIQRPNQSYEVPPSFSAGSSATNAPQSVASESSASSEGFSRGDAFSQSAPLRVADSRSTIQGNDTLLSTNGPTLQVSTVGPDAMVLGKQAVFRVSVSNSTDMEARDVVFTVPLPANVDLASNEVTSGQAAYETVQNGGKIVWRMPQLPAHGRAQLSLTLIPRDTTPLDLRVNWTASATSRPAHVAVLEPKLEVAISGPVDVVYGSSNLYTIVVSNPGEAAADNVILTLPAVAENQEGGGARMLGTIPAGERRTIQFELTARQEGSLPVQAKVVGDGGLSSETKRDVLVRRGVLELTLQGPGARYAGTPGDYSVIVTNTGNASADQVHVKATLPEGSTYLSSSSGGRFDEAHHCVEWDLGTLHPSGDHTLSVQCLLMKDGDNNLNVQSDSADGLNVFETLVTHVEPIADVKLIVNDPPGPVQVGADAEYEITVQNRGTKAAENVRVVAFFDEGVDPISLAGGEGSINAADGTVIFQTLPQLGPGEDITLRITAQARKGGSLQFRAEVECSNPQTRLAADESTVFYSVETTSSSSSAGGSAASTAEAPRGGSFQSR